MTIAHRYLLGTLVLLLIAALVWLDFGRRYLRATVVKDPRVSQDSGESTSSGDWELLFDRRAPGREEVAVIADKNVFSPLRKAWAPPPPEPEVPEEPAQPEVPPAPVKRDDLELLGTSMIGEKWTAMIHFRPFNPPETLLLGEGEKAGPQKDKEPLFTVLRIEADKVFMQDEKGQKFELGLYDRPRQAAQQTADQSQAVVTTAAPAQGAAPASTTAGASSVSTVVGGGSPQKSSSEAVQERNEQLVREGKMRKIITPFGPVYRKQ